MIVVSKRFSSTKVTFIYKVEDKESGLRLDQFLLDHMNSYSRESIKRKIKDGHIYIADRSGDRFPGKKPSTKITSGDLITVEIHKTIHEDEYWNGELLELELVPEILFEDENLYIISKPPFMSTHPTGKHLFNCATVYFEQLVKKTVHSIHRIDRETSGVLLLGKNPKASSVLTQLFEFEKVKKCYFFISFQKGKQEEDFFIANERLAPTDQGLRRVEIKYFDEKSNVGKRARTRFKIVHREGSYAIGLAFPSTGRQHQIRVHAMAHGLPLIGDKIYYGSYEMFQRFKDLCATKEDHLKMEIPRHALHAMAINFPYQGESRVFSSPIPNDLKNWITSNLSIQIKDLEESLNKEIQSYFLAANTDSR